MAKIEYQNASPLTRRTFLEQFGLVGGSALVMSAMRSWDLMAAQAGPKPVLSGRPTNGTKVLVLGAGVSGLTTCYELNKLGYNATILEARDGRRELDAARRTGRAWRRDAAPATSTKGGFQRRAVAPLTGTQASPVVRTGRVMQHSSTRRKRPTSTTRAQTSDRWPTSSGCAGEADIGCAPRA